MQNTQPLKKNNLLHTQYTKVERYPTEIPLFLLAILLSLPIWAFIVVSILGVVYFLVYLFILFLGHTMAITYIRGSGIKVTPEQLANLYYAVENICLRLELKQIPEIYIIQGNGLLNAMATKFAFTKIFVIYSNLLDACENNPNARAMIIGHELGHLRAGHLRWNWLIWPGLLFPFLGNALSRAREYTADRYGAACVDNKQDALSGLIILAGGKNIANKISIDAFTSQIKTINTGFMRIGEWLHSHPTIVRRICALEPSFNTDSNARANWSVLKGISIILLTITIFIAGFGAIGYFVETHLPQKHAADPQQSHIEEPLKISDWH